MDTQEKSVMVALLPMTEEWSKVEFPHLTLVYAGEIDDLKQTLFNTLVKEVSSLSILSNPIHVKVTGIEVFGDDNEQVDVLRISPTSELLALRTFLEDWDKGEFPVFKPHVTIGPANGVYDFPLPMMISFDRIMVGWGETKIIFWLRRY